MEKSLEIIHTVLFRPRLAVKRLEQEQPLFTAMLVLLVAAFVECLGTLLVARSTNGDPSSFMALGFGSVLNLIRFLFLIFVGSIFLPAAARMVGGSGKVTGLAWVISLSFAVWTISFAMSLGFQLTPFAFWLRFVTHGLLTLWTFWIHVQGLSESHRISTLRAAFAAVSYTHLTLPTTPYV